MPRDRTPRPMLALAALLIALQFLGVPAPGASGQHSAHDSAAAPLELSTDVVVTEPADESTPCGDVGQVVDLTSWLAGRDRRHAVEPEVAPPAGGARGDECSAPPPGGLTASHLASRSPATHSLASLQLFRC
ncbi:hypothetical protein [Streptomyces sp. NPDC058656]|uniref:hypothetical protein n=1 Tax=unclassified Streptomyces TaxID=2593676 RepID=UPI00364EF4B9